MDDYTVPDPKSTQKDIALDMQTPANEDIAQPKQHIEANAVPDNYTSVGSFLYMTRSAPSSLSVQAEDQWPHEETSFDENAIIEGLEARPLTPVSRCIDVRLPAERIQTAVGRLEECPFPSNNNFYGAILLAHARVYAFAQYHLVTKLQAFALQRVLQVLRKLDCTQPHAVSEILPLIEYVYGNTVGPVSQEGPLRKLVSQFVAIHFTDLMRGDLEELFGRGGDFTVDVARKILRRLLVSGGSTKLLEEEIADLEKQIRGFKLVVQNRDSNLRTLTYKLREWESWECGTSKKGRKKSYH